MAASLTHIWRHPIKSHGHEAVASVRLSHGQGLPMDRVWAVIHANSPVDAAAPVWASSRAFVIGTEVTALVAMAASTGDDGRITLSHPDLPPITLNLDLPADQARLIDWTKPLMPAGRPAATAVIRLAAHGVFDTDFPSISINNLASLDAVSDVAGQAMDMRRFRGNLWLSGLEAWEDHGWLGRDLRIGTAILNIVEPVARCAATTVNPETGKIDVETPYLLRKHWGHRDFGVYAKVVQGGDITLGDKAELI